MVDHLSKAERSALMKTVKQTGTDVELLVRRGPHRLGLRYVLADKRLPGCPDLSFPRFRAVVFVHGCYWHGHDCSRGRGAQSNIGYWSPKIAKNKERDARVEEAIRALNWRVFVVWGCDLRSRSSIDRTVTELANRIRNPGDRGENSVP